jgi:hypothetical protein
MTEQEKLQAWRAVRDAYREAKPPNLRLEHLSQLGVFGTDWLQTKDPSVMEGAISYCHQHKLPILPELLEHVHAAMQKRIADGTSGTKAFKQSAKQRVLEEMAKFIYHGASLPRAAELGAYIAHVKFRYPMKASTLEKEFPNHKIRLSKLTQYIFEDPHITQAERAETKQQYEAVLSQNFLLTKDMKGERR